MCYRSCNDHNRRHAYTYTYIYIYMCVFKYARQTCCVSPECAQYLTPVFLNQGSALETLVICNPAKHTRFTGNFSI